MFFSIAIIITLLVVILLLLFNSFIYTGITKFLSVPGAGKIREMIKDMHREIHVFRNHKKMILGNLALSFIIQVISPVSIYFIGLSLGIKISLIYFLIFLPIIGAITLLPISIGGLGLREGLYVVYFAKAPHIRSCHLPALRPEHPLSTPPPVLKPGPKAIQPLLSKKAVLAFS